MLNNRRWFLFAFSFSLVVVLLSISIAYSQDPFESFDIWGKKWLQIAFNKSGYCSVDNSISGNQESLILYVKLQSLEYPLIHCFLFTYRNGKWDQEDLDLNFFSGNSQSFMVWTEKESEEEF